MEPIETDGVPWTFYRIARQNDFGRFVSATIAVFCTIIYIDLRVREAFEIAHDSDADRDTTSSMTDLQLEGALRDLEKLEDELHRTNSENADRLTDIRSRLNGALIDEEIAAATGGVSES